MVKVEGWRDRHDSCRFGTYRPEETEGLVVDCCNHPEMRDRYDQSFCARACPAFRSRPARAPHGRIPTLADEAPGR